MNRLMRKLSVTLTLAACIAVVVISAAVRENGAAVAVSGRVSAQKTIVLDAGHGGIDGGCVAPDGTCEKDINLAIVQNLRQMLEFSGYNVVLTRSEDVSVHDSGVEGIRNQKVSDMENRLEIIKSYPESVFVSVHQNQYTDSRYFGAQMFYTTNNSDNFRLATVMQKCFAELQPDNDREIKLIDNELYLFKTTEQPALLIECGFLSNPDDAAKLKADTYQKQVAFTIYKGLMSYFESGSENKGITENGENQNFLHMQRMRAGLS